MFLRIQDQGPQLQSAISGPLRMARQRMRTSATSNTVNNTRKRQKVVMTEAELTPDTDTDTGSKSCMAQG